MTDAPKDAETHANRIRQAQKDAAAAIETATRLGHSFTYDAKTGVLNVQTATGSRQFLVRFPIKPDLTQEPGIPGDTGMTADEIAKKLNELPAIYRHLFTDGANQLLTPKRLLKCIDTGMAMVLDRCMVPKQDRMTRRDYLAAAMLQGALPVGKFAKPYDIARSCYAMADILEEVRTEPRETEPPEIQPIVEWWKERKDRYAPEATIGEMVQDYKKETGSEDDNKKLAEALLAGAHKRFDKKLLGNQNDDAGEELPTASD